MSPLDESVHLRALFDGPLLSAEARLGLLRRMQTEGLRRLAPHLPAGFCVDDADQCIALALQVEHAAADADATAAARLLRACVHALESPDARTVQRAVDAYALLDAPAVAVAQKFRVGRKQGTVGPWRQAIRKMLVANPEAKNADMWTALRKKPPRGWKWLQYGERFEGPGAGVPPTFVHKTFLVYASEERKRLAGISS